MNVQWIALAIGCALVVALLGGAIVLFQSEAMWDMTSPNAQAWNATLNCSATAGFNIIPIFIMVIVGAIVLGFMATARGFCDAKTID